MDTVDPVRFILAFIFVIGLIGLLALALKHYGNPQKLGRKLMGLPAGSGRIAVKEIAFIDARHKLVLVRRDEIEHLLLIGDGRELVIESNIAPGKVKE